jgi:transcriptional regulator with XRE-family HTH domain
MSSGLDDIDHMIGRNIRFYRLLREFSQAKLAARIGMSYQQLQKYERGINRISANRLLQIAQALEVSVAQFFEPNAKLTQVNMHRVFND